MEKVIANCNNKIWVFLDANYDVVVIKDTDQVIHCKVTSPQLQNHILMSFVYAKCTPTERRLLWSEINNFSVSDTPWCIGGDSNIVA